MGSTILNSVAFRSANHASSRAHEPDRSESQHGAPRPDARRVGSQSCQAPSTNTSTVFERDTPQQTLHFINCALHRTFGFLFSKFVLTTARASSAVNAFSSSLFDRYLCVLRCAVCVHQQAYISIALAVTSTSHRARSVSVLFCHVTAISGQDPRWPG